MSNLSRRRAGGMAAGPRVPAAHRGAYVPRSPARQGRGHETRPGPAVCLETVRDFVRSGLPATGAAFFAAGACGDFSTIKGNEGSYPTAAAAM
eukprot:4390987-Pyramimonas_sp.AAC.1